MNYNIVTYCIYIAVSSSISIWVAKSLHKNTKIFLIERYQKNEALAIATNNLIQIGFYLMAFGYSFMKMNIRHNPHYEDNQLIYYPLQSGQETIEELALKLGHFTLALGILFFINFFIMLKIQRPKKQMSFHSDSILNDIK